MHQPDFIRLCLELGVLRFGEFKLKSGRLSPYFFNAGLFNTGHAIAGLGRYYARAAALSGLEFDMLFGPAYKGIPLGSSTASLFSRFLQKILPVEPRPNSDVFVGGGPRPDVPGQRLA